MSENINCENGEQFNIPSLDDLLDEAYYAFWASRDVSPLGDFYAGAEDRDKACIAYYRVACMRALERRGEDYLGDVLVKEAWSFMTEEQKELDARDLAEDQSWLLERSISYYDETRRTSRIVNKYRSLTPSQREKYGYKNLHIASNDRSQRVGKYLGWLGQIPQYLSDTKVIEELETQFMYE